MDNTSFVSVFQPSDTVQAGLIRSALEGADIICYVDNENLASVQMGGVGIGAGRMSVMVPENEAEQAISIIKGLGIE
jgi:hypothetical protein